jgi:multisubunit Na+/H+ antiporter MnhG subunit
MEVLLNKNSYYKIAFIIITPFWLYIEDTDFQEEYSKSKTTTRIYNIIIHSLIICFLEYYNYTQTYGLEFLVKLLIFVNAYFITNIIIQHTFIDKLKNNKNDEDKQIKDSI